jgi:hypothetical protein
VPEQIVVALALIVTLASKLGFTVTTTVLLVVIALLHADTEPEEIFVIVTVVLPRFNADVVNVPVPDENVIVAVFPVAFVVPVKSYVTVYVPEAIEEDCSVMTEVAVETPHGLSEVVGLVSA